MVELPEEMALRDALSFLEMLWRSDPAAMPTNASPYGGVDPFGDDPPTGTVRLMNFSGQLNGRQMPNKSLDHGEWSCLFYRFIFWRFA